MAPRLAAVHVDVGVPVAVAELQVDGVVRLQEAPPPGLVTEEEVHFGKVPDG